MKTIKYFSAFSGIGGFEIAIEQATQKLSLKAECVGFSEINPFATSIYQYHFREHKNYEDITQINPKILPDFDLVCGGFPCQSYSVLGKRGGIADPRGQLFFPLADIIRQKQPKYIVLENVKGLLSADNGEAFLTILKSLDELGYYVEWQILNGTFFGTPQTRERIAIVGLLGEKPRQKILSFSKEQTIRTCLDKPTVLSYAKNRNKVSLKNTVNTITASYRGLGGFNQPAILEGGNKIRRLTPLECERLQGLPDYWTLSGSNGEHISDTRRYELCGNAICVSMFVPVISALLNASRHK